MSEQSRNSFLSYKNDELNFGLFPQPISRWTKNYQGPTYLYDLAIIKDRYLKMKNALQGVDLYYAMKANSNLEILKTLQNAGCKIDVVSLGEIERALQAGFRPQDVVFSGVGKTIKELSKAIDLSIHQINVESFAELVRITEIAQSKKTKVSIALRLNPNISIDTHPYIATGLHENKFGIELSVLEEIKKFLLENKQHISLKGISLHLGSQMLEFSGLREALQILKKVYVDLKKDFSELNRFDFGGGLGIHYEKTDLRQEELLLNEYAQVIQSELSELADLGAELQSEPGRWLVAHAGLLLTEVQYLKPTPYKNFIVVDSGMNHLLRPALYEAFHQIFSSRENSDRPMKSYDVVGPICESADFLGKSRLLHECQAGDFLAIADAGAYGFSMANTYNLQALPQEITFDSKI